MSETNLATIEAMYFFLWDYQSALSGQYNGEYDDILYHYAY